MQAGGGGNHLFVGCSAVDADLHPEVHHEEVEQARSLPGLKLII